MPGGSDLDAKVSRQSEQAIRDADAVIVVVDAVTGVTEEDSRVAEVVRDLARGKVLVAVNKVDDANREGLIWEALSLGLGDPHPVSALHGRGAGDLLDRLVELLPAPEPAEPASEDDLDGAEPAEDRVFGVAVVGRPNVGKSTLFNRLIGEERAVVHDLPGHHPRHHRHRRGHRRRARSASSTPPACAARPRSTRAPSTTPSCGPCRPSTRPTSPCS